MKLNAGERNGVSLNNGMNMSPRQSGTAVYETTGEFGFLMQQLAAMHQENGYRSFAFLGAETNQGVTSVLKGLRDFGTLVNSDSPTLMIDANFVDPQLHEVFYCARTPGLADVLAGEEQFDASVIADRESQTGILPAGYTKSRPVFSYSGIKELMKLARDKYDYIFIDLAPLSLQPESLAFCRESDCVILIVASECLHARAVERVNSMLTSYGCSVGGIVLNRYRHVVPQWLY